MSREMKLGAFFVRPPHCGEPAVFRPKAVLSSGSMTLGAERTAYSMK